MLISSLYTTGHTNRLEEESNILLPENKNYIFFASVMKLDNFNKFPRSEKRLTSVLLYHI